MDLPGYGFAEAPKPVVERWQALLRAYLAGRPTLRRVFLLVDARHGIKAVDGEIMALLDRAAVTFQVVLTKADKPGAAALGGDDRRARRRRWRSIRRRFRDHRHLGRDRRAGIGALRAAIAAMA